MQICNPKHSKFLGLMINSRLSWQTHTEQMIPKLNTAAYAIRSLKQLVNLETLKMAYFAFAHSILSYGIIFIFFIQQYHGYGSLLTEQQRPEHNILFDLVIPNPSEKSDKPTQQQGHHQGWKNT